MPCWRPREIQTANHITQGRAEQQLSFASFPEPEVFVNCHDASTTPERRTDKETPNLTKFKPGKTEFITSNYVLCHSTGWWFDIEMRISAKKKKKKKKKSIPFLVHLCFCGLRVYTHNNNIFSLTNRYCLGIVNFSQTLDIGNLIFIQSSRILWDQF